jgi:hypothetical protein
MAKALDAEVQGRKFRFEGIKTNEAGKGPGAGGAGTGKQKNNKSGEYGKSGTGKGAS